MYIKQNCAEGETNRDWKAHHDAGIPVSRAKANDKNIHHDNSKERLNMYTHKIEPKINFIPIKEKKFFKMDLTVSNRKIFFLFPYTLSLVMFALVFALAFAFRCGKIAGWHKQSMAMNCPCLIETSIKEREREREKRIRND